MDYIMLVFGIIVVGFSIAITIAVLRWALRINETIALLQSILDALRNQSSHNP